MKKILTVVALTVAAFGASAMDQATANGFCKMMGDISGGTYLGKAKTSKAKLMEAAKPLLTTFKDEKSRDIVIYAINYGYKEATSQNDAYMVTWAYCMGRLDQ